MPNTSRRLRVPQEIAKYLRHLHPTIKGKVRHALNEIISNPYSGKPLRAELAGLWSLKVGCFRIIYRPNDNIIDVVAVGPRSVIYERVTRLMRSKK